MGGAMSPSDNGSSGHGKPPVTIFVNTREFKWDEKEISYEQVYNLGFPNEPLNDGDVARIEYSRGHNGGGAGTLHPGESVNVKVNMVFDVYVTVRS
jgi:Multiubiquitin